MHGDVPFWLPRVDRPPSLSQLPDAHLLSCDAYPTAADSRRVQEVITEAKLHLSSLQLAIGRVQGMLQELKDSKNQLSAYIEAHEAVVAPIRRIHDDILIEIFMHCLPPPYEALPHPMKAPLLLARVCQRWRAVIYATPMLWSTISLVVESYSVEQAIKATEHWMSASAQCPLNITLRSHDLRPCQLVLDLLLPHAHRWKNVSLQIPYQLLNTFSSIRNNLSSLEYLRIDIYEPSMHNVPTMDYFSQAPRLSIVDHGTSLSPSSLILPWSQLTSYSGYMKASEMLVLFKYAQQLTEADIVFQKGDEATLPMVALSEPLECLKTLRLVVDGRGSLSVLPLLPPCVALHQLDFKASFLNGHTLYSSNLDVFLNKSGGRLETLSLDFAVVTDRHLLECLQHTPRLVELYIRDAASCALTENLMKKLTKKGPVCLLPHLKRLCLSGDLDLCDHSLIPMIQSRWRKRLTLGHEAAHDDSGCMEQLVLDYCYGSSALSPTLLARLQSLKHNGYSINIQTYGIEIRRYDIFHSPPFVH